MRALALRVRPWLKPLLGPLWPILRRIARRLGAIPPSSRPIEPAPSPASQGAAGPCVAGIELHQCTVLHSYLLLRGVLTLAPGAVETRLAIEVTQDGVAPPQTWRVIDSHGGGSLEFALECLADRARPPSAALVRFRSGAHETAWHVADLLPVAQRRDLRTLMPEFQKATRELVAREGRRPVLVDLGGRARSRNQMSEYFPDCTVSVFDIVAAPEVDVVGDAHELSRHYAPESVDFILSVSVFEHLLMPWKVAVEMSRVMRTGGIAPVHSHQAEGMHDRPWDFLRFSDTAWSGIFNRYTGFEIVRVDLSRFMHVVPAVILEGIDNSDGAGGFQCSAVIVRKTGPALVDWPVPLGEVVKTSYPQGADAHPAG